MSKRCVWIIEYQIDNDWFPCPTTHFQEVEAQKILEELLRYNKYRLVKYVPEVEK